MIIMILYICFYVDTFIVDPKPNDPFHPAIPHSCFMFWVGVLDIFCSLSIQMYKY